MKIFLHFIFFFLITSFAFSQTDLLTPFEKSKGNYTATYQEVIDYYSLLSNKFKEIKIEEAGSTDIGKPLHIVIISGNKEFDVEKLKSQNKRVVLILNGIHPGEPEGIDASMMLARDLVTKPELKPILNKVVVVIVPIYNVDGSLNRNSTSRANQNGPKEYGFRGNAQNLDLNRDFIKCDSKNAKSFTALFHKWNPDVFIDTHTSNGADYQYVITYIATQKDKLHPILSAYMVSQMQPSLEKDMKAKGYELSPYVNTLGETPESGIAGFLETPRYASGYTALFNTIGFIVETHMLKPFDVRLKSTYSFLASTLNIVFCDSEKIKNLKSKADYETATQTNFPLNWKLDTTKFETFTFKGFKSGKKPSNLSGLPQLYYDNKQPIKFPVKFYNTYSPQLSIQKPTAYIIPQAWEKVINYLAMNNVKMERLQADTVLEVEAYYIVDYKTTSYAYENHYLHSNTKVEKKTQKIAYFKGDYMVYTNQKTNRYIVETLEPENVDSFFNWNFFDGILQQKEYFSDYVFEDVAAEILAKDKNLKTIFDEKIKTDALFAHSQQQQLMFVYKNSPYYERTHQRFPVTRLIK